MKIKTVERIVKSVLIEDERTRYDDFILIQNVYKKICPYILNHSFEDVMEKHFKYDLPPFSSIVRARRKIFSDCPNLKPESITRKREKLQEEYKKYAKGEAV